MVVTTARSLAAAAGALELDKVLEGVARHAQTAPGAALCTAPPLAATATEARAGYSVVLEAMACVDATPPPLPHRLDVVQPAVDAVRRGATLDPTSLATVGRALLALAALTAWAPDAYSRGTPTLAAHAAAAAPPARLLETLQGAFALDDFEAPADDQPADVLSSEYFPRLARRRQQQTSAESRVESAMGEFVSRESLSPAVRRDGRLVVPLPNARARSAGSLVSRSRSGATSFVEPSEIVPLSAG